MTERWASQVVSVLPYGLLFRPQPPYQQQLVFLSLVTKHESYMPYALKLQYVGERAAVEASKQGRMGREGRVGGRSSPQARLLGSRGSLTDRKARHGGTESQGRRGSRCKPTGGPAVAVRFLFLFFKKPL